ncbi:mannitol dehydrogenase family protein [Cryobacterium sp. TMT4-31]|uniref:mannitol dehydrogenase family protein n=1 Tax=Cryobacterium sp. TMT4-31 TaxID=1259259 RepID=UPI00106A1430|nr:mannitol dehydrogenase family protein [Cryobacterium sp. TMT4-31]TFC90054.1 mannitol dehydrogenase family protein [Cryobacterium sp. TMT4-31]
MIDLNEFALRNLPHSVPRPTYDRSALRVGIVHVGVGGFHRAHMAMTLDSLFNRGLATDWAICGIGLLESDRRISRVFKEQDSLYTLTIKHPDGVRQASIVGSIVDYLFAPDDPEVVIEKMADPDVHIISLTITEGGYNFDRLTGEFDSNNPAVVADLVDDSTPSTVFGFVTEALRRRRDRGITPFTVLSCDNIQGNGDMAARMFTAFAELKDPVLAKWITENVTFPNSMVDRITPVTTKDDIDQAAQATGLYDQWPVVCEPFFQWVIEDNFASGRPALEHAGVQFVENVEPYELMKLRLLNASHQGLCYFGYLAGYRYAHEAVGDPAVAQFLRRYMDEEASPTLAPVPGIDLTEYKNTLIERFLNPEIRDTLARLCAESSDRIPKWLIPVIRAQLESGGSVECSAAIVASWARYAEGIDEAGAPILVVDALREQLISLAVTQYDDPLAFIQNRSLFGDLAEHKQFTDPYLTALASLHQHGALVTVRQLSARH